MKYELSAATFYLSLLIPFLFYFLLSKTKVAKKDLGATEKYKYLDGLRGLAATAVFIHHSRMIYNYHFNGSFSPNGLFEYGHSVASKLYVHAGQSSVLFFFMITGFLFYGKLVDSKGIINSISFYTGRLRRIVPGYITCVVLAFIIGIASGTNDGWGIKNIAAFLTSSISFGYFGFYSVGVIPGWVIVSGVLWTLTLEWFFYFLVPFMGVFSTSRRKSFVFIVCLISWLFLANKFGYITVKTLAISLSFALGFIIAELVRSESKIITSFLKNPFVGIIPLVLFGVYICDYATSYELVPVLLISLVLLFICSNNSIYSFLSLRLFRLGGKVSYSVYILHGVALNLVGLMFSSAPSYPLYFVISSLLMVMLSFCNYFLVEKTFIKKPVQINSDETSKEILLTANLK
ncbi:acyltransferase family protein [Aeromonas sp. s10]|uniref:acyltransferase family protein n=1 Tax=Aeromonas sp. s10 TaxID=3138480 RepID=UPI0034A579A6